MILKRFCFTELCKKEVICISDGKKIGFPADIEIDKCGNILYLHVPVKSTFSLFAGKNCVQVPWCDVERIGCDVIWVRGKDYEYGKNNSADSCCCK